MLSMALMVIGFSSCGHKSVSMNDEPEEYNNTTFVLKLNTVNRYSTRTDVEDQEKIKTLRIVITDATDKTDKVEINQYFSDVSGRDFYTDSENEYIIQGVTPGKKNVYIFANEESVTDISWTYTGDWGVKDLHDLLEGANNNPDNFGDHINSVTFFLNQNNIYINGLPYSSNYKNIDVIKGKRNEYTFYLVPVATKFRLNFYNYRNQAVTLSNLNFSSIANKNYLIAHIGELDYNKSLPGESEKKYWIDWLHEISNESWNYGDQIWNEWFNSRYGWITEYSLPEYTPHNPIDLMDGTNINVPKNTNPQTPDPIITRYFPESQYNTNNNVYKLEMQIDGAPVSSTSFPFPDLHLFRNTFVDLDIIFSQKENADIIIKYTVCPWYPSEEVNIRFD